MPWNSRPMKSSWLPAAMTSQISNPSSTPESHLCRRSVLWRACELGSGEAPAPCGVMKGRHESNIFALAFLGRERLVSAGNDRAVLLHDLGTGRTLDVWPWEEVVYALSAHPSHDRLFIAAAENGEMVLKDTREQGPPPLPPPPSPPTSTPSPPAIAGLEHRSVLVGRQTGCLVFGHGDGSPVQAAAHNPAEPLLVASASLKNGAALWDLRNTHRFVPLRMPRLM